MLRIPSNTNRQGCNSVNSESRSLVKDHGNFVSSTYPSGDSQTLSWKDLIRVEVRTNDSGPWGWDVWWVLSGSEDEVSFPLGATGQDDILDKLQAVTGAERDQLIQGMNCTSNRTFVCWHKGGAD